MHQRYLLISIVLVSTFTTYSIVSVSSGFITFINSPDEPALKGFLLAVSLYLVTSGKTLICQQWIHRIVMVGVKVRGAIVAAIYKKVCRSICIFLYSWSISTIVYQFSANSNNQKWCFPSINSFLISVHSLSDSAMQLVRRPTLEKLST